MRSEDVALDGVREDHGWLARVFHGGLVGGVDLPIIVSAALKGPDLFVSPVLDHRFRARVATEEVFAHVGAVVRLESLVVAVQGLVHDIDEGVVLIGCEELIPAASPNDLDDVPARALEEGFELLNDLAVASDRTVKALQVAVDDEGEVVEALLGGELEHAARFWLIHFAIADEGPRVLLGGVFDSAKVQVAVEPRLVDRLSGAKTEGDGRVFPKVGELTRVRVGGESVLA